MQIERLKPAGVWDSTPYDFCQAIRVRQSNDLLFIAGQVGMNESGQIAPDIEAQIRQAFENIRRIVAASGGTMANVVRITGYLRDMKALELYSRIVREVFGDKLPAATLIQVSSLALDPLLVEIDAIAAV